MNDYRKNITRTALKGLAALLIFIVAGTVLMIAAYCFPVSMIQKHTGESIDILENEYEYYGYAPRVSTSYPDHYTDALMLSMAAAPRTGSVIYDAMNCGPLFIPSFSYGETLMYIFGEGQIDEAFVGSYPRYWHGYLIWLKPMLTVMTYSEIRILAMCFQLALLFWALYELRKKDMRLVPGFFFAFLFLNPITTALSIQYASVYCITLIMTAIMLHFDLFTDEKCPWVLFGGGIAVAFFDFFTYPVVALGIPLIISVFLSSDQGLGRNIRKILTGSFAYFAGYAGMWGGKWITADLLIKSGTIRDAINEIFIDATGAEDKAVYTIPYVYRQILMHITHKSIVIIAFIFLAVLAFLLIRKKCRIKPDITAVLLLVISLYPFVWYAVVKQHSATMTRMEQRELAVTIMGIVSAVLICLKRDDIIG
ncbi:MAG: hypothetical protein J5509_01030 [Lachnospiraceae bacterium]|nr:hypothetical protein [Lachnospiraceae bacterium]